MNKSYEISDKDEFIRVLEDIVKREKTDSTYFQTEEGKELILRFNSSVPFVFTYPFTKEEKEKVQGLWNSLRIITQKKEQPIREQKTILKALESVVNNWGHYSMEEKKNAITKINEFQTNADLLQDMTLEEREKYYSLWNQIKEMA